MIPKIIHFMWLDKNNINEIPNKYQNNIETFKKLNPNFIIKFWFNNNIYSLLQNYPQYLNFFNILNKHICKCDFARLIVLYHYGGIYSDLDFYCNKNLEPLTNYDNFFVIEPPEHFYSNEPRLINGFFGCSINDKFIKLYIEFIINNYSPNLDVLNTTGTILFYKFFKKNENLANIIDTCLIIPYNDKTEITSICVNKKLDPYVYTKWIEGSGYDNSTISLKTSYSFINKKNTNYKYLIKLFIIILIILVILTTTFKCCFC